MSLAPFTDMSVENHITSHMSLIFNDMINTGYDPFRPIRFPVANKAVWC